jgi:Uma2 family endonuclease
VLSPTDKPRDVRRKISNYLATGTIVWLVDPDMETIEIHAPGQPVQVLKIGDTLTGGTLLPGFSLALSEVFA